MCPPGGGSRTFPSSNAVRVRRLCERRRHHQAPMPSARAAAQPPTTPAAMPTALPPPPLLLLLLGVEVTATAFNKEQEIVRHRYGTISQQSREGSPAPVCSWQGGLHAEQAHTTLDHNHMSIPHPTCRSPSPLVLLLLVLLVLNSRTGKPEVQSTCAPLTAWPVLPKALR